MKDEFDEIKELLQEMGHDEHEITKIVARLREFEKKTHLDSIMDSIGHGDFDLAGLIKEALQQ